MLIEREEPGANYPLTGPAALTMDEMALALSESLDRAITYQDMPEDNFRRLLVEQGGVPEDPVDVQVMLHFAAWKRGDADLVTEPRADRPTTNKPRGLDRQSSARL